MTLKENADDCQKRSGRALSYAFWLPMQAVALSLLSDGVIYFSHSYAMQAVYAVVSIFLIYQARDNARWWKNRAEDWLQLRQRCLDDAKYFEDLRRRLENPE